MAAHTPIFSDTFLVTHKVKERAEGMQSREMKQSGDPRSTPLSAAVDGK